MNTRAPRVVAGVSAADFRPPMVRWAAAEAAARNAELCLVAAVPPRAPADLYTRTDEADATRARARDVLDRAARDATEAYPELRVFTEVVAGPPVDVLRETAAGAVLLVVGADDQSPFAEAIAGSVPGALLTTSPCPLVVIPRTDLTTDSAAPVTVALDQNGTSQAALAYAFAAARQSGRRLDVLRCVTGSEAGKPFAITGFSGLYPDVELTCRVEAEESVEALVRASRRSALLVLGSRGRGQLVSSLFGSVSRGLIRRSGCPVVVARPGGHPDRREDEEA